MFILERNIWIRCNNRKFWRIAQHSKRRYDCPEPFWEITTLKAHQEIIQIKERSNHEKSGTPIKSRPGESPISPTFSSGLITAERNSGRRSSRRPPRIIVYTVRPLCQVQRFTDVTVMISSCSTIEVYSFCSIAYWNMTIWKIKYSPEKFSCKKLLGTSPLLQKKKHRP